MRSLWRMLALIGAYPKAFTAYLAASLLIGSVTAGFLGLLDAVLGLLQTAAQDADGPSPRQPLSIAHLADVPVAGDAVRALTDWYASVEPAAAFKLMLAVGVGLFVLKCALEYGRRYLEGWLRGRLVRDTQISLARHLLSLDYAFFQGQRQGEVLSRLTNDLSLLGRCVRLSCHLVSKPFTLIFAIGAIVLIDWRLSMIMLVVLPVGVVVLAYVARKIRKASRRAQERTAGLTEIMMQFLSGMRVVKAFGCEEFEAQQFARENDQLFRVHMKRVRARGTERVVSEFMTSLAALAVLALGGYWVLSGRLEFAKLMTFYLGLAFIHAPLREISAIYGDLQETVVGAVRVFDLMDRRADLKEGDRAALPADTTIRFEHVDFHYHPEAPVLRDFSLTLPAGKTVALIGRTGCGKSTVADLLLRLRDPVGGRIAYGGCPLADFTFGALRGGIAFVNQDSFLFNSTLRDNIAYGTPDADPARVEAAARAAQIHDDIVAFPDGYDTLVGERGTNLSGGQRQRIAIARAIFKDAPVLVLDEATSALDAGSEARVQAALDRLMDGRTCLVIAHRLSTVRRADVIACLEDGRVSAAGTHEEMLRISPTYAGFVALQAER